MADCSCRLGRLFRRHFVLGDLSLRVAFDRLVTHQSGHKQPGQHQRQECMQTEDQNTDKNNGDGQQDEQPDVHSRSLGAASDAIDGHFTRRRYALT